MRLLALVVAVMAVLVAPTVAQPDLGRGAYLNISTPGFLLNLTLFNDATGPALSGAAYCDLLHVPGRPYYEREVSYSRNDTVTYEADYDQNADPDSEAGQNALLPPLHVYVEVGASVELVLQGTNIEYDPEATQHPAVPEAVLVYNVSGAASNPLNSTSQPAIPGFTVDQGPTSTACSECYTTAPFYSATFAPTTAGQIGYIYGGCGECVYNFTLISSPAGSLDNGL